MVMLLIGEFLAQPTDVMIVDQRNGPHHFAILVPFPLHQPLADHIADKL